MNFLIVRFTYMLIRVDTSLYTCDADATRDIITHGYASLFTRPLRARGTWLRACKRTATEEKYRGDEKRVEEERRRGEEERRRNEEGEEERRGEERRRRGVEGERRRRDGLVWAGSALLGGVGRHDLDPSRRGRLLPLRTVLHQLAE